MKKNIVLMTNYFSNYFLIIIFVFPFEFEIFVHIVRGFYCEWTRCRKLLEHCYPTEVFPPSRFTFGCSNMRQEGGRIDPRPLFGIILRHVSRKSTSLFFNFGIHRCIFQISFLNLTHFLFFLNCFSKDVCLFFSWQNIFWMYI